MAGAAIAFKVTIDNQFKLVICASVDCTGGGFEFRTIDPGPHSVGGHVAMTFDSAGHAAFVYQDSDDQTLLLARCQNAGCGNVDIEVMDDYTHIYRSNTSIALSEAGASAISEHWTSNYGDGGVKFIFCTTASCAGTWEHVGFMTAHPVGSEMSMALRADFTRIFSYHDDTDDTLDLEACLTTDCSGVSTHQINFSLDPDSATKLARRKTAKLTHWHGGLNSRISAGAVRRLNHSNGRSA